MQRNPVLARGTARIDAMRRLHRITGLFPLAAYLVFHAWEHWPVRAGRDALFERLGRTRHAPLEILLVLLPLAVHAGLGLRLAREPAGQARYASAAFRRLQIGSGVGAGAFLGMHLVTAWLPRLLEVNPTGAAAMSMSDHSGTLAGLALHVMGLAAVCTHLGQGLCVVLAERIAPRAAQVLGIGLAVLLWLVFVDELAAYATGAPLL